MADVLVVEDDPAVRALLVLLVRQLGHQPREAASAEEGLLACAQRRPDLLLLDLMLPGLGGAELLEYLDRGLGRPRSLVVVSALPEPQVAALAARHGARYLCKPFRSEAFAAAVDAALADVHADAGRVLDVRDEPAGAVEGRGSGA